MAIETHNVTSSDVLDVLPFVTSGITASSSPVSTTMITGWIEDGAGELNGLLERHGIDPTADMTENGSETVKAGIVAYAAYQSLIKAGFFGEKLKEFKTRWKDIERTLRKSPQDLGNSQSATDVIKSNVDPDDPTSKKWDATNFGGW